MANCKSCGAPDKFKEKLTFIHDSLSELQKVVHAAKDDEIRGIAFHAVIDLRTFVKELLLAK